MTSQTNNFRPGQRVQIVNIDADGTPAAYHGCAGRIMALFSHDGMPAARIRFAGGIEKKIATSKLQLIDKPAPVASPDRTERAAALPEWAGEGCKWTLGSELQAGDTIYFSAIASPRVLVQSLTPEHWKSTVIVNSYGLERRIPGQLVEVDTYRWYVVKRAVL